MKEHCELQHEMNVEHQERVRWLCCFMNVSGMEVFFVHSGIETGPCGVKVGKIFPANHLLAENAVS